MGLNVSPLHHQDNVKEDPTVSESQQPPEQSLGVLCTAVGIVDAVWVGGLCGQLTKLGELLLLCHSECHTSPHHCDLSAGKTERTMSEQVGDASIIHTGLLYALWHLLLTLFLCLPPAHLCLPSDSKPSTSLPLSLLLQLGLLLDDPCPLIHNLHPILSPVLLK